ncbi:MAG: DUF4116 domain-containing protein [Desulfovibrio sp.]|nr:DUF4116 domain-containing protein [Desulfovibrio sp.]
MIAVNGSAMQDVPGLIRTPELCLEAVRQDGKALEHVPYRLRRASLCLEAVRNGPPRGRPEGPEGEEVARAGGDRRPRY